MTARRKTEAPDDMLIGDITDDFDLETDAMPDARVTLISSAYDKANNPDRYDTALRELTKRGQRLLTMRNHCKLILMHLTDGTKITVESSANLRSCDTTEQVAITNDPGLFDFHADWMNGMFDGRYNA